MHSLFLPQKQQKEAVARTQNIISTLNNSRNSRIDVMMLPLPYDAHYQLTINNGMVLFNCNSPRGNDGIRMECFGSSHFNALDNNRIGQPLESRNHTGQTSWSSSHVVVEPAHIQAGHYPSGINDDDYTIFDISAANVSTIEIDCRPIYNVNWRKRTSIKRVTTIQLPQTIPPTTVSRSGLCTVDDSNKREGGSNNSRQQNTYQT